MEDAEKMLTVTGALAEILGVFRDELEKKGFDDEEIIRLCVAYLRCLAGGGKGGNGDA